MDMILKLLLILQLPAVLCQDDGSSDLSKAFITLGILFGALVISLIVAKIVDFCYDRSTLSDDASDISEHTRKLIRARLAVMAFPKRGEPVNPASKAQRVSRVIRIWSAKSKRNSQISADIVEKGGIDVRGEKQGLKVAFIDIPDTIPQKDLSKNTTVSTLQVPLDPDVMVLESADDLSDNSASQNIPVVLKVPVLPPASTLLKQETKKPVESQMNGAKSAGSVANTDTQTIQLPSTPKSIPKNETKSSTAVPTPLYVPSTSKPLNKSKSAPSINPRTNSPMKEKPQNAFRSPSPPKILVKKPTESEFVPVVSRNPSTKTNIKTVSEKDKNQTDIVTTQPKSTRTMSAKSESSSPRQASEKRRLQTTARSAPSKILSTSNDDGKKMVHFKAESKKSAPPNKSLK
ncbi:hypothetical protein LOTGIDRAFT_234898 [Lottia gigantea]|uniref:Uncharacterized protein n=1 Tax=Lottia gigantea TaxID=225164 RepID=V3ZAD3_LOTGI|nr:hypothetical protein LOTGIDRAFT_234898 [Lottia gigantea]ESO87918.1 hypothetical protein LOTGIDRAFT_234898 [Lottia gigantea]